MTAQIQDDPVNLLLVDDRPSNLASLRALLSRPDYNLVSVASGPEALTMILRQEFALILLDVAMPGMDGFETASIIKQRDQSKLIPILFITASVFDMEHVFKGYTVGAVDYLRKPLDPHAVRAKVAVFVELYRQRKQIEAQAARLHEAESLLRARSEDALRDSEALYQVTFEQAPVGIGHASPEGQWTRVNGRFGEILDAMPAAVIGRRVADIGDGGDGAALARHVSRVLGGEPTYRGEHRLTTEAGRSVWVDVTVSALGTPPDGTRRLVVLLDDITERKQHELERGRLLRELQEGIRARNNFLSIAAHELKTPVTPLRLQAASLLRELRSAKEVPAREVLAKRIATIDRAADRLGTLVERLLEESRLSSGRVVLELAQVDLVRLVRNAVSRHQEQAAQAATPLSVSGDDAVLGRWDPLRVDQIISNLLTNAIKYGQGKPVEVRVTADPNTAHVVVRDRGVGIPLEEQGRLFERFERVAPLHHFSGFGLGLWMIKRLAAAHGGTVSVRSQPGEGSEFAVDLPRGAERAERLAPGAGAATSEARP